MKMINSKKIPIPKISTRYMQSMLNFLNSLRRLMYEVKQEIFKQMPSNSQSNILLYQKELSFIKRYIDIILRKTNSRISR
ncbi:hypothetical protein HZS_5934 [Henneguya salminicola]|nr:hypothetical protein HZS_5934 [Henneguya salminicola]